MTFFFRPNKDTRALNLSQAETEASLRTAAY
jgi:hypothetical protein